MVRRHAHANVIAACLAKYRLCGTFFCPVIRTGEKEYYMSLRAMALGLAATFVAGSALACPMHDTVAQKQTPVDYSKLKTMDVAEVPVDAWLIKYLDEWQKA
jgi:hypothetical protein